MCDTRNLPDTEPLVSAIEWGSLTIDAEDLLDQGFTDRRQTLQAIEDLSRYAAIEDPFEVSSMFFPSAVPTHPGPTHGAAKILHVLVDLLALQVEHESRAVEVMMTVPQAKALWNVVMGEDKPEDLALVRTIDRFAIEGALG